MSATTNLVAKPNLQNLPKSSLLRLYDPAAQGNSFSLDGFPVLKEGKEWLTRLVEIIEIWGAVGMTTNQTLFRQLTEAGVLDDRLRALKAGGGSTSEIYWTLYNEAATQAAKAFEWVHGRWPWDGRVSQEASAFLAELDPLVKDVQRIAKLTQGLGAFTKIPNVPVGPQAIQKVMAAAEPLVNPNITLVFSDRHYLQTVEGYLLGLNARRDRNDLGKITSVNSLFVSRVDRVVDLMIDETLRQAQGERLKLLKGKVGVAQAKKVFRMFETIFLGAPFQDPEGLYQDQEGKQMLGTIDRLRTLFSTLKGLGARPQRLLIASSGVKSDQPYSPLLYVLPFLGSWSANTMPEPTLESFSRFVAGLSDAQTDALRKRDLMREPLPAIPTDVKPVGEWDRVLLMTAQERKANGIAELTPDRILKEVSELVLKPKGTSLRAICDTLRDKGAASFASDEQATLQSLQAKLETLYV
ncbi:MAG: hypothetical protein HY211_06810 [Candidatus Omnitrophica bacterium]|nr:hypothetical protein [Candidatus Omnitrophota bacterium]